MTEDTNVQPSQDNPDTYGQELAQEDLVIALTRQNDYMRECLRAIARGEIMGEQVARTAQEVLDNSRNV